MDISHIYNKITHHHLYNSTVGDRQTRVAKVSKGLAQNRSCLGSDWDFWFLNCGAKPKKNTAVGASRIIRKQLLVKLITNTFDLHGCRHTPLGQGRKSDRFLTCSSSLSCRHHATWPGPNKFCGKTDVMIQYAELLRFITTASPSSTMPRAASNHHWHHRALNLRFCTSFVRFMEKSEGKAIFLRLPRMLLGSDSLP